MSSKIRYTDEAIGEPRVIDDFLPPPHMLALKEDGVKVTIALSRRSIDFFKSEAAKSNVSYQKMIRRLLDAYTERYASASTRKRKTTSGV